MWKGFFIFYVTWSNGRCVKLFRRGWITVGYNHRVCFLCFCFLFFFKIGTFIIGASNSLLAFDVEHTGRYSYGTLLSRPTEEERRQLKESEFVNLCRVNSLKTNRNSKIDQLYRQHVFYFVYNVKNPWQITRLCHFLRYSSVSAEVLASIRLQFSFL